MLKYSYDSSGNIVTSSPKTTLVPPEIIGQPVRQVAEPGNVVTFSVVVSDANGVTFQWKLNGTDIPGATGDSVVRSNVGQSGDGDLFTVVVTNSAGSVTSASAALLLDTDGDGLPDTWEAANFADRDPTHPLNPANQRSESDPDHDGISNLDEFLENTDPKADTSQKPRLTVYRDAGGSVAVTPVKLTYDLNETVTLTAAAFAPSVFIGWSGDLSGTTNPVQLALSERQTGIANRTIWARFATAVPPPPGLIALWRGETDATDPIGGHHGTFFAGDSVVVPTVTSSGKVGGAFSFDGTVHIRVPGSPLLKPPQLTVEAWIFPLGVSGDHQTIIAHGSSSGSDTTWFLAFFALRFGDGSLSTFPLSEFLAHGDGEPIPFNQWTHLALSFDGATLRVYTNGAQVAWQGGLAPLLYDPADVPLTIGSDWVAGVSSARFTGLVDEVSLYNRALTPAEVADIYGADRLGKDVTRPYFTSPSLLPETAVGAFYTQTLTAVLGTAPIVFSLTAGTPPPGITVSPSGVVSGAAIAQGAFQFTVLATDVFNQSTEQQCILRVQ